MTLWFGFATFVEIPAERPAKPAPMMMRWRDILDISGGLRFEVKDSMEKG